MKQFKLEDVELVIETNNEDMSEAEALEIMSKKPWWFHCQGVGHDANTGKIIILFSDSDEE